MATQNSVTTRCVQCSKPATQVCIACKDAPDIDDNIPIGKTYYCNSECQRADWSMHKSICKRLQARKALYRVGSTLQKLFYMYRENCFDKLVDRIERRNGKMYIHEGNYNRGRGVGTGIDFLEEFPSGLCKSEEEKWALLTHLACSDALMWMHEVTKYMIGGLSSNITERLLNSKNHKRDMVAVALDGFEQNFDCYHEILDVTLKSGGERYVLDLAGAQVGYYEPVTPYEEYFESRVREFLIYDSFPNFSYFGGRLDCALSRAAGEDLNPSNESLCTLVNNACRKVLKAGVVDWEKEQDIEIGAMLLLPQQGFELR